MFSLCSQVREVKNLFSGLVFSITSQVREDARAEDIVSPGVLRDVRLLTSHARI